MEKKVNAKITLTVDENGAQQLVEITNASPGDVAACIGYLHHIISGLLKSIDDTKQSGIKETEVEQKPE